MKWYYKQEVLVLEVEGAGVRISLTLMRRTTWHSGKDTYKTEAESAPVALLTLGKTRDLMKTTLDTSGGMASVAQGPPAKPCPVTLPS